MKDCTSYHPSTILTSGPRGSVTDVITLDQNVFAMLQKGLERLRSSCMKTKSTVAFVNNMSGL